MLKTIRMIVADKHAAFRPKDKQSSYSLYLASENLGKDDDLRPTTGLSIEVDESEFDAIGVGDEVNVRIEFLG